ncbi:glycosyltransferase family 2 protein [Roseivirga echinicomitans]|uniref:Glycosyl transferase n=1 Tax=Roseivirga echinicomitans TaxID=296218 RepID=A0A150XJB2_9BACT|nr:glycosyltransferase family 2 protein [Roseivirga echinicomitans]KYG78828.1 glycosyl transferase [Roseivirga echinicomitans]
MNESNTKVSGLVITYNEEHNIARCLESLIEVCDEVIVVDSYSTDKTKSICQSFDIKFIEHPFEGHIQQKNYAVSQANNDVVLSLDADEELSSELKKSIKQALSNWNNEALSFNRFTNYCGKWIKHSGWYPDTKIRLWNKKKGAWGGVNPHDSVELENGVKVEHINGDLLHYSYYTIEEHIVRSAKYAKIAAKAFHEMGKNPSSYKMIFSPLFRFTRDYFLKLGILDGFYGLIICSTNSYTTFLKYAYLRQLNLGKKID